MIFSLVWTCQTFGLQPLHYFPQMSARCHAKYVAVPNNSQYEICATCELLKLTLTLQLTLTGLYILPSLISSFLNRPNISQHLLGRFSWSFCHVKGICNFAWIFSIRTSFSNILRDVAMATNFGQNLWPLFNTLAFRNGFDCRNFDSKIFSGNIFSTYYAHLIKIGPVTSEKLQIVPWFDDRRSFAAWRLEMDWNITILISAG